MAGEIQLKTVKYVGDNPDVGNAYQNAAYRKDSDIENGASLTKRRIQTEADKKCPSVDTDNIDLQTPEEPDGVSASFGVNNQAAGEDTNCCLRGITDVRSSLSSCWKANENIYCKVILFVLFLLYLAYFIYAMIVERLRNEPSIRLLWVTCVAVFIIAVNIIQHFYGSKIKSCSKPCTQWIAKYNSQISWVIVGLLFGALVIFVLVDVFVYTKQYYNLVSAVGIFVYVLLFFIFSYCPAKINWRTVIWGLGLQLMFAVLILRWEGGHMAFRWLGDRVSEFLAFSNVGSKFVFGDAYEEHFFAFKVLPTIIFFSTVISILYYWGVMQVIVRWVAAVMQFTMGTTAGESMNAAGNIFIGQTEAPLMIRPLLADMTKSELHAVMTGGFATVAGGVLAAYILFGVPANHLLSASVMSAPAALAMAKLLYPETEQSKTTMKDVKKIPRSNEVNVIAAASNGASQSISLVANVAVNVLAFVSLLSFIDSTLTWFGNRVGQYDPPVTFKWICSYVLCPLPFLMGIEVGDCRRAAELIGVKTFLNEFIAYVDLSTLIHNREALANHTANGGNWTWSGDNIILQPFPGFNETQTLANGIMSVRSEVISTYALCGFANLGSIGVQLGGLGAMAPERRSDLAAVALRAMIAGNVACFMTACIAGLFYNGGLEG